MAKQGCGVHDEYNDHCPSCFECDRLRKALRWAYEKWSIGKRPTFGWLVECAALLNVERRKLTKAEPTRHVETE